MLSHVAFGVRANNASVVDDAIRRLPESAMDSGAVASIATRTCAQELFATIASGQPYRVVNAIKALSRTPSQQQLRAIVGCVCDAISADAYRSESDWPGAHARIDQIRTIALETIGTADRRPAASEASGEARSLVFALTRLAGARNANLPEHLAAAGALALRIARQLGFDRDAAENVELAAALHDIASAGVASAATDRHMTIGESILLDIPALRHLAPIVRSHHERFDGNGFPDGLRGEQIPIASRIIAVADAFLDLTSFGDATLPTSPNAALHEIEAAAGSAFDPLVVAAAGSVLTFETHRRARSA